MLHTLRNSPWQIDIAEIVRMLCKGDDLLLIQDGVLAAIANSRFINLINKTPIKVSALKEDIEARGLIEIISNKIKVIKYTDFVDLAVKHIGQICW